MCRKFWGLLPLVMTISLLMGCGAKPHIEIYMEPVAGETGAQVDTERGLITIEQKGVRITLEPLDEVKLFELTEDAQLNPYIFVSRWGNVEPLYTVFGIRIRNTDNKQVVIDETAILIDEDGEQYASLPYDYFRDLYNNITPQTAVFHDIGSRYSYPYPPSLYRSPYRHYYYGHLYRYRYRSPYRVYHAYPNPYHLNTERMVVRETIFDGGKLFPGAKRKGLLVFDLLDIGATDVKVVIPQVLVTDGEGNRSTVDFEFDFRQIVAVEE